jgi:hypothetical protein
MKTKQKFVDELSGKEFDTKVAAIASEAMHADLNRIFKDYKGKDPDGSWKYYQRTQEWVDTLADKIIEAIKKYEPWIVKSFKDDKKEITREHIGGYYIGRCLDDGNSPINHYYRLYMEVCRKCLKQYEQCYFAIHCCHDDDCKDCNHERKDKEKKELQLK